MLKEGWNFFCCCYFVIILNYLNNMCLVSLLIIVLFIDKYINVLCMYVCIMYVSQVFSFLCIDYIVSIKFLGFEFVYLINFILSYSKPFCSLRVCAKYILNSILFLKILITFQLMHNFATLFGRVFTDDNQGNEISLFLWRVYENMFATSLSLSLQQKKLYQKTGIF